MTLSFRLCKRVPSLQFTGRKENFSLADLSFFLQSVFISTLLLHYNAPVICIHAPLGPGIPGT